MGQKSPKSTLVKLKFQFLAVYKHPAPSGGDLITRRTMLSANELIKVLETRYEFTYNDREEIEELEEILGDDALVFNYEGDFITECEEPDEGDPSVEEIYKFIRKSGWSLEENPLDMNAWILYPTKSLTSPMTTLM